MNLSLHILKDWLAEFSPVIACRGNHADITGIRLYQPGTEIIPYVLYLGTSNSFFRDGKQNVVCRNQEDYLHLQTEDFFTAFNRIQDAFSFYSRWYNGCRQSIRAGCPLDELLNKSADIFRAPIVVVDAAQIVVAQSRDFNDAVAPEDLQSLRSRKTIPEEKLRQFNQAHRDSFYSNEIYVVPAGFFPTKSYCEHIFIHEERVGTVILKAPKGDHSPGTLHLLELFAGLVEEWIAANGESNPTFQMISYFVRALDGAPSALGVLQRQLSLFDWEPDCKKQVFVIQTSSEQVHFDLRLTRSLAEGSLGIFVIPYHDRLVLLCNMDLLDPAAFPERVGRILTEYRCCCAVSFGFTALDQFLKSYRQAMATLEYCPQEAGQVYRCQDVAMRVVARVVHEYTSGSFLHPAVPAIREYDRQHKSEYYRTLLAYLKHERRQQAAADELFIHRNTLFLRLEKIQEIWPLDLDDPEERFYLLFSFYQDLYGRNSSPDRP